LRIGVDHRLADLRLQPEQGMHGQRHAAKGLQALVDAAHAAAASAGEHHAGDLLPVDRRRGKSHGSSSDLRSALT
jgi:hypothetical protein